MNFTNTVSNNWFVYKKMLRQNIWHAKRQMEFTNTDRVKEKVGAVKAYEQIYPILDKIEQEIEK